MGATINAVTTGAVRLKPSLRLPDDKSTLLSVEAGITVNDILHARLAPTTLSIIASVFGIIASAWFLTVVFPFDFAHFADVVLDFLRFLVSWITNDIARVLIALE